MSRKEIEIILLRAEINCHCSIIVVDHRFYDNPVIIKYVGDVAHSITPTALRVWNAPFMTEIAKTYYTVADEPYKTVKTVIALPRLNPGLHALIVPGMDRFVTFSAIELLERLRVAVFQAIFDMTMKDRFFHPNCLS